MKSKSLGFTLIEVLITVAIVAVVAAIAIPAYKNSIDRSNRADAITDLTEVSQRLQRCFTTFGRFDPPQVNGQPVCDVYQALTSAQGIDTRRGFYNIRMFDDGNSANNSFTYEIRATVVVAGAQRADADCQMFSLNERGVRGFY
jgi:type IV pilus assembly protein PilE